MLSLAGPALLLVIVCMLVPVGWLFYLSFFGDDGAASLGQLQKYDRTTFLCPHLSDHI